MKKKEYEEKLKKTIRLDTYYMLEEMQNGLSYIKAKEKVLKEHKEEFKPSIIRAFVKEPTILSILKQLGYITPRQPSKVKRISNHIIVEEDNNTSHGIYGIYMDGKLVYIGMTERSFKERWEEHIQCIMDKNVSQYLYKYIRSYPDKIFTFHIILDVDQLNTRTKMQKRDLQSIELALITLYQPVCNIEGRLKLYCFNHKK